MAQKKRVSTGKSGKYAARPKKPQYSPVARTVCAFSALFIGVVLLIAMLGSDALLLRGLRNLFRGLVGYGFYVLPFCLLLASVMLFLHRGKPVVLRVTSAMLLPVNIGAMLHILLTKTQIVWGFPMFGALYLSGAGGTSGGLISGFFGVLFQTLLGKFLSVLVLVLLLLLLIIMACNMTLISLIRAIHNRPRPEREEQELPPVDTATALVNHVAQKHMEYASRKKRFEYDVPIDEEQPEQPEQSRLRKAAAKSPDQLLAERRSAALEAQRARRQALMEAAAASDEAPMEAAAVISVPVIEPEPAKPMAEAASIASAVPAAAPISIPEAPAISAPVVVAAPTVMPALVVPNPDAMEKVGHEEAKQAAAEIASTIAAQTAAAEPEYVYPPAELLNLVQAATADGYAEMRECQHRLDETLKSFGIDAEIQNVTRGPSVTRYELKLDQGVRLSKITNLSDDIALSLGASGVRISAIPDQISVVGIEVPNKIVSTVYAREVIDSEPFKKHKSKVAFALGKDIGGTPIVGNIAKLPHMLIAGTTGSGKSVCMNTLIISLLFKAKPEEVKLIMVDPKMVELGIYNGIPHLLIPVVTDPKKAAGALQWAVNEMMKRYRTMADAGVRDLDSYNKLAAQSEDLQTMPQLVVVIDELADLMLVAAKEVEESICRVAQMGRASGIHLVIATQRPSADVITGLMKANIPSRIAFAVASSMESRIILDTMGAEKLVGKGDMLFAPLGQGKPLRVQGCFISDDEVQRVVEFIKQHTAADYNESVIAQIEQQAAGTGKSSGTGAAEQDSSSFDDEMLPAAVDVILETGQASVSMLQRRLKLGYARAARIMDEMEEKGIVGPFEGSKPRQLLITRQEWNVQQGIAMPEDAAEPTNEPVEDEIP
ncbi:MAG: DNA translocase FtsK [Oscillospiraceae bacterium]|nr:DNA translocase FtsK [Oscillospiraceae bacterium]